MVHNCDIFSNYGLSFIFDSFIITHVCYTLLCIMLKIPTETVTDYPVYSTTRYERTSMLHDITNKTSKGSIRILKGKYEADQKCYTTDLVYVSLANHLLKMYHNEKDSDKEETILSQPFLVHDLCGAKVHLLPKDLQRKRIFNKKYPICIAFSESMFADPSLNTKTKCDYISFVSSTDSPVDPLKQRALHLFAISDREKESWFWALRHATNGLSPARDNSMFENPLKRDISNISFSALLEANDDENLSISEDANGQITDIRITPTNKKPGMQFQNYMNFLLNNFEKTAKEPVINPQDRCVFPVDWMNVMIGRLAYDFLTQKKWAEYVISEVQRKLDKIEMPNFVDSLKVTDVSMGYNVPQIHSISEPMNDDFGLWFDLDFTYEGSFRLTLKTNLKVPPEKSFTENEDTEGAELKQNTDGTDSSDEESSSSMSQSSPSPSSAQNRLINKIERWISHKHFQTVAQSRFVKKYVGDISNVALTLTLTVNSLEGVLTLNVPPAPSDRVWFGFRKDPLLSLAVYPKVGAHQINVTAIVQLIERKLIQAFKKAIVLPNMEDLVIPVMFAPIDTDSCAAV